jgi:hypothetical protein
MKTVPVVKHLEDFQLSVSVAGGSKLPYSGYVEVEVHIPFIQNDPICVPMLVMRKDAMSTDAYLTNAPHQNYYVRIEMQYSTVLKFYLPHPDILTSHDIFLKLKRNIC